MSYLVHSVECIAHTQPGAQHKAIGSIGQDQLAVLSSAHHTTAVLCDGCGSAAHGFEAAAITSRLVCSLLHQNITRYLALKPTLIHAEIWNTLEAELFSYAEKKHLPAQSLACTIVAATLDSSGRAVCLHLGDGGILSRNAAGLPIRVSLPETGLLKNLTFHTMNTTPEHFRLYRCSGISALLLYSDGIEGISRFDFGTELGNLLDEDAAYFQWFMNAHQNGDDQSMALLRLRTE